MDHMFRRSGPNGQGSGTATRRTATLAAGFVGATALAGVGLVAAHVPDAGGECHPDKRPPVTEVYANANSYDASGDNFLKVAIDGGVFQTYPFDDAITKSYTLTPDEVHTYEIRFVAHDDPDPDGDGFGSKGYTKKYTGTIQPCVKTEEPPPPTTPPVVKNPKATVKTTCTGKASARLNNRRSNAGVRLNASASKRHWSVFVGARKVRNYHFEGRRFRPGTVIRVSYKGKVLDRARVPKPCFTPPPTTPPDTGQRQQASNKSSGHKSERLFIRKLGINARVVMTGKTKGGRQAVTHSLSDTF